MQEKENTVAIKRNYDEAPEREWKRTDQTIEFLITARMLEKMIHEGERVLDIGGGPGRYSLWLAERGCRVTLFDLSSGNIAFARGQAKGMGLQLETVCGNAVDKAMYPKGEFDHVLVMGPMYHLFREEDRRRLMENALDVLKPGGKIYLAFINLLAGVNFYLDECPEGLAEELKSGNEYGECVLENRSWQGMAFTEARFDALPEIRRFINSFGLKQVALFGQGRILPELRPWRSRTGACGSTMLTAPASGRSTWPCPAISCMWGRRLPKEARKAEIFAEISGQI